MDAYLRFYGSVNDCLHLDHEFFSWFCCQSEAPKESIDGDMTAYDRAEQGRLHRRSRGNRMD